MRKFVVTGLLVSGGSASECIRIKNKLKSTKAEVIVLGFKEPSPELSHCTRVWPNEDPELALFPVPPGCLFFNPDGIEPAIQLAEGKRLRWISEPELEESLEYDPFKIHPLECARVMSRTITGSQMIVVGESCNVDSSCTEVDATSTCESDEEPTQFLEETGWHRNLGALLHAEFRHIAHQWLPKQFFAEIDELDRKTGKKSVSLSIDVNIENPSLVSPAQIVQVNAFPFPVHARVNPPKKDRTHFTVHIPKAVWLVNESVNDCSVESFRIRDYLKLHEAMDLEMWKNVRLVRAKPVRGDSYAITDIPTGNPEDLQEAILVTAVTATLGAVAIVFASLRS